MVLWFGQRDHINIGYSSTDPAQVKRQIADMVSRGMDGVVMVWYGPNNAIDRAATLVMQEAEAHPGFTFAIMVDNGAIRWNSCSGCDPQRALVHDLQYVEQTFFPSPAYLRIGGRPVIGNFDIDKYYKVDWSAAKAALATDPCFSFKTAADSVTTESDGAYSWDIATTTDYGMSYLTNFYTTGASSPAKANWGAAYKGFNDQLASWGLNRVMGQQCGQTWLQTFSKINSLYDSTHQLPVLQLVTWNDYEEGTEVESGIDNCVNVSAAIDRQFVAVEGDGKRKYRRSLQRLRQYGRPKADAHYPDGDRHQRRRPVCVLARARQLHLVCASCGQTEPTQSDVLAGTVHAQLRACGAG